MFSPMHKTLFEIQYKKTFKSTWKTLPNASFYSQRDAEYLADNLAKVVWRVVVVNNETEETVYEA